MASLTKLFIKRLFNPIYWRMIRRDRRFSYSREFENKQFRSMKINQNEQSQKLYDMIKNCHENIPYYKRIIDKNKITYSRKTITQDIKKFPVLTKKLIRENFKDLQNINYKGRYFSNSSGGSTGEPLTLLQTEESHQRGRAFSILVNKWLNRDEGEVLVKLWGAERDIFRGGKSVLRKISEYLMQEYILNTFKMSESSKTRFLDAINKKKPKLIISYVQSIYELARYAEENKLKVYSPSAIMTSAGTLYPHQRKLIESVFKTKVINYYGSREVSGIASECLCQSGMHLNIFNNYYEILTDNLKDVRKNGQDGELYITTLTNKKMPLIRYAIGDVVTYTSKTCPCKRGLPIIGHVKGRTVDLFTNSKGVKIDGEYFTHLFYFREWVALFRVIQKKKDLIQIMIVKKGPESKKDVQDIEDKIRLVMGKRCKITWKFVKSIPSNSTGKYRYTISEVQ